MKLYYSPGMCSLAVHIVLRELDASFDLINVDMRRHVLDSGRSYYEVNPLGYVPVLELADGSRLTEVAAILQYLGEQADTQGLIPPSRTAEYYRHQQWLVFIATELQKAFSPLFAASVGSDQQEMARAKLRGRFEWVDKQMSAGTYLMGAQFSVADAYLFAILRWADYARIDLSRCERLIQYRERVLGRPAVMTALQVEGLVT